MGSAEPRGELTVQAVKEPVADAALMQSALEDLWSGDARLRAVATDAISFFGDSNVIGPLLGILAKTDDPMIVHFATVALVRLARRSVPQLLSGLMDRDAKVRLAAAWALGFGKDTAAVGPLLRCRHDEEVKVRQAVVHSLGLLGDRRALQPLIEALSDTDKDVAALAAETLGTIGGPEVVEPLIRCLDHPWRKVRRNAADALGSLREPRAVEPLIRLLQSGGADKMSSIKALGNIGDPRPIDPLLSLLSSPLVGIRNQAARALVQLGAQDAMRMAGYEELCSRASNSMSGMANMHRNHLPQTLTTYFELKNREKAEEYRRQVLARGGGGAASNGG